MVSSDQLGPEIYFTTSRSRGPGGQHVNKVESRVSLHFDVLKSKILDKEQKDLLLQKLQSHITSSGILILTSQEKRSQSRNKKIVVERLDSLLQKAFAKRRQRKATRPSKAAVKKRLKSKMFLSEKKRRRQGPLSEN